MLLIGAVTPGDESGTDGQSQGDRIDWSLDIAERHTLRLHANAAGGRSLARGQSVDLIVHDDIQQIDIAAHGVDEMVSADSEAVTVSSSNQHCQFVISELQTCRHREGPAVQ